MGNLYPVLGRKEEGRELFLRNLQLRIILMPKRHILGCHIVIPCNGHKEILSPDISLSIKQSKLALRREFIQISYNSPKHI